MKKMLLSMTAMLMVMGSQAQAAELLWITNEDIDAADTAAVNDGEVTFSLSVADTFVYKMFNDGSSPAPAAGKFEDFLDFDEITAGISAVSEGGDCSGLTGLAYAQMSLGAVPATCVEHVLGTNKYIHLEIPLSDSIEVSGDKGLDVELSTAASTLPGAQPFRTFELRSGAPDGSASLGSAPADLNDAQGVQTRPMHMDIEANLVSGGGQNAYSNYGGRVIVDLIVD